MALAALGRFGSLPLSLARDRVLNLTRCAPKLCRSFRLSAACVGERMGLRRQFFVDSCQLESSLLVGRGLCRRCHGAPSGATNAGGGGAMGNIKHARAQATTVGFASISVVFPAGGNSNSCCCCAHIDCHRTRIARILRYM